MEQARNQVSEYERIEIGRDMLGDLSGRLRGRAGFDDNDVSVADHAKLSERVSEGVELVPAGGLVEQLRAVKDASEVAAMRAAAEFSTAAYERCASAGWSGVRSARWMSSSSASWRTPGRRGPSFPPIVAAADHGAQPHAEPRDVEIPKDTLVVIDMGAIVDGYYSDCTRTLATGSIDDDALEIYELVLRAQTEALAATRAGAAYRDVDAVARDLIDAAGHAEHFGHGLGHGVGLHVHEGPRLGKTAEGLSRRATP